LTLGGSGARPGARFIEQLLEEELQAALGRGRYERGLAAKGHRNGHRDRRLNTTFGPLVWRCPEHGWPTILASGNGRANCCQPTGGKDAVSRAWRKTRSAWEAWQQRDLADEEIMRLILDGTVVKVRLDRRATGISLLIVLGIRRDGQKVVLTIKNMGGESQAAWRAVLDDLLARGLAKPELVIVDGGKGLEAALASLWDDVPVQRCSVHKERNLLAHAPKHLHDEIKADFNDMVHARTAAEVMVKRKAFLTKWRLRCRPVAISLEEAGERLFTFLRYPPEQWRSLRTTNAIERLHEEFKRRIKTQCLLPCAETAAMLFWALLASGQITMRRVDGWQTLERSPTDLDLAA
jgi:putative transposase